MSASSGFKALGEGLMSFGKSYSDQGVAQYEREAARLKEERLTQFQILNTSLSAQQIHETERHNIAMETAERNMLSHLKKQHTDKINDRGVREFTVKETESSIDEDTGDVTTSTKEKRYKWDGNTETLSVLKNERWIEVGKENKLVNVINTIKEKASYLRHHNPTYTDKISIKEASEYVFGVLRKDPENGPWINDNEDGISSVLDGWVIPPKETKDSGTTEELSKAAAYDSFMRDRRIDSMGDMNSGSTDKISGGESNDAQYYDQQDGSIAVQSTKPWYSRRVLTVINPLLQLGIGPEILKELLESKEIGDTILEPFKESLQDNDVSLNEKGDELIFRGGKDKWTKDEYKWKKDIFTYALMAMKEPEISPMSFDERLRSTAEKAISIKNYYFSSDKKIGYALLKAAVNLIEEMRKNGQ